MSNLLTETTNILQQYGRAITDVRWIGSIDGRYGLTWDEFALLANVEYHSGFGAAEVAQDLVVVGDNWWLERHEYDGSEWWEYKSMPFPQKQDTPLKPERLTVKGTDLVGWKSLHEVSNGKPEWELDADSK